MSKPLNLRIPSTEAQLIRDIAEMLGEKPGALALSIFRVGIQHMDIDPVKIQRHFSKNALRSSLDGLMGVVDLINSVIQSASQEQAPASQKQLLLKSRPVVQLPASQEQACERTQVLEIPQICTGTLVHGEYEFCPMHDGHDDTAECTGRMAHSEHTYCPLHP